MAKPADDVDYSAIARAMGAAGERVSDPAEVLPALRRAMDNDGPVLLDVITDRDVSAPVTNYEHLEERVL